MKKLKMVKNHFEKNDFNKYKNKFKHKQIRFVFSKIALIFKPDIDIKTLCKGERKIFLANKDQNMFVDAFKLLENKIDGNIDWNAFGKLMWYSYQTSSYWKDSKKEIKNIFTKNNYVQKNSEKRDWYYKWLKSLPKELDNYNEKILKTLKVVF